MKIITYEEFKSRYAASSKKGWNESHDEERNEVFRLFLHAVLVEGSYLELGMALRYTDENTEREKWTGRWYAKSADDYGYYELFFKDEKDAALFKDQVPTFYTETEEGTWRTDGYSNRIPV